MGRWIAAAIAFGLMVIAGVLWMRPHETGLPVMQPAQLPVPPTVMPAPDAAPLPVTAVAAPVARPTAAAPDVDDAEREAKRFARVDKDHDKSVTRDEFLATRRKSFAKLDTNKDGVLSFEESAAKTIAKFTNADADNNGKLTPGEFEATAKRRKASDDGG